jgi:hypothetical protein
MIELKEFKPCRASGCLPITIILQLGQPDFDTLSVIRFSVEYRG